MTVKQNMLSSKSPKKGTGNYVPVLILHLRITTKIGVLNQRDHNLQHVACPSALVLLVFYITVAAVYVSQLDEPDLQCSSTRLVHYMVIVLLDSLDW